MAIIGFTAAIIGNLVVQPWLEESEVVELQQKWDKCETNLKYCAALVNPSYPNEPFNKDDWIMVKPGESAVTTGNVDADGNVLLEKTK